MSDASKQDKPTRINGQVAGEIGRILIWTEGRNRFPKQIASDYHRDYGFEVVKVAGQIFTFGEGRTGITVRRFKQRFSQRI